MSGRLLSANRRVFQAALDLEGEPWCWGDPCPFQEALVAFAWEVRYEHSLGDGCVDDAQDAGVDEQTRRQDAELVARVVAEAPSEDEYLAQLSRLGLVLVEVWRAHVDRPGLVVVTPELEAALAELEAVYREGGPLATGRGRRSF